MSTAHRSARLTTAGSLIPDLRTALAGRVIAPADDDYDRARTVFYGGIDRRPAAIVRAAGSEDVIRVVALARETGLPLAVRGGGHSAPGFGVVDGGIVLDLSRMKAMEVDAAGRAAWAESGLTAGEYTAAAGAYGLATGFGDTGSVGIGGITLSGGVGYLARKHGLTIDSLLAAEVVTADGRLLRVDDDSHPDLFRALRGGGGNFGVVTRFRFRLHEVDGILGGMLLLPATPEVIAGLVRIAAEAPEELSAIINVMTAPPMPFVPEAVRGRLVVLAFPVWAGEAAEGERVMASLRSLAAPIVDLLRPMRYPEVYPPEDPSFHPTAVAHRTSPLMVNAAAFYRGPEDRPQREAWVAAFAAALDQGDRGAYVGFLGDEGPERIRAAYPGATWARLVEVKRRYDPTNLFRHNHNIPPSG